MELLTKIRTITGIVTDKGNDMMKKSLFLLAVLFAGMILAAQETNLVNPDQWQFNDPARVTAMPDGSFELNSPDKTAFAEMKQVIEIGQTSIQPLTFSATFRTLEGNEYYRKESS